MNDRQHTPTVPAEASADALRFRRTLVRVLAVQVLALALLGLLQYAFRP